MSIFASLAAPEYDDHTDECGIWDKSVEGVWDLHPEEYCNCGRPDSPLVYRGSHVLPSEGDKRGGHVDLALIPGHITRDARDNGENEGVPWPFLRFGVNNETVILTRRNVEMVAESLNEWLLSTSGGGSSNG